MPPIVVLTVPHCIPLRNYHDRSSDTNAENMANALSQRFRELNIKSIIIKSKQNRMILDDNRYMGNRYTIKKDSGLWDELRVTINTLFSDYCVYRTNKIKYGELKNDVKVNKMSMYPNIILIDCHSFPSGGFGNNDGMMEFKNNGEHKVVILDYPPYQKITQGLIKELNKHDIKASLLEGAIGRNSILDVFTLHPIGIQTVLFEVREDLEKDKLDIIASIVEKTISNGDWRI